MLQIIIMFLIIHLKFLNCCEENENESFPRSTSLQPCICIFIAAMQGPSPVSQSWVEIRNGYY